MATKTITITCTTDGTEKFTARSSTQSSAISVTRWNSTTFSSTTNNGSVGLASNRYYVSSFFFNKGNNSSLWNEIRGATVISATLLLNFSSVGSYTTNVFTLGKKSTTATNNWGVESAWKTAKRVNKSDRTISYDLGSGSGDSIFPSTGAYCIGQLNYAGSGNAYNVSSAVLTVVIEEPQKTGGVYLGLNGTKVYCDVYIGINNVPVLTKVYCGSNGVPVITTE